MHHIQTLIILPYYTSGVRLPALEHTTQETYVAILPSGTVVTQKRKDLSEQGSTMVIFDSIMDLMTYTYTQSKLQGVPFDCNAFHLDTFSLRREEDVSGVSGTGDVAHGVVFPDGRVAQEWVAFPHGINLYRSKEHMLRVHGHEGRTRTVEHMRGEAS